MDVERVLVIAEILRHFLLSAVMNVVEREELINLESVERNYLKLRKSGVDEALRPVDNTGAVLFPVTGSETCYTSARQIDHIRTSEEIHMYW